MAVRRDALDQLLSTLNKSPVSIQDKALFEVVKALILEAKRVAAIAGGTSTTVNEITQIQQFIDVFGSDGGGDDGGGIPGQRGADGVAGAIGPTGATGPPFPSFIYVDADIPEQPMPIKGDKGDTGATGATGAIGPQAIGFVLEGEPGEDGLTIVGPPGSAGASATGWSLISNTTAAGAAQYDFTGLGSYLEIMVIVRGITRSVSGITALRVSIDNGANFLSASGDYVDISAAGVDTNGVLLPFHTTATTLARSGRIIIKPFGSALLHSVDSFDVNNYIIPTANALNAIRVYSGAAGGNLNAGSIQVWGRT